MGFNYLNYRCISGRVLILLILFIIIDFSLYCQHKKVSFQSLQDGLSHHQIRCILKDSQGFMWFGTSDGLNKFNGANIVVYENNPEDSGSLCYNSINAIIEDKNNNMWIGTSNGLNLYNREKDNYIKIEGFGRRDVLYISTLFFNGKNILWIGTAGNGLFSYNLDNSEIISYSHNDDDSSTISSNFINSIIIDNDNNIWIATRSSLDLFNSRDNTFDHLITDSLNPGYFIENSPGPLTLDKEGNLWLGTHGGGLIKLVKKDNKYIFKHYQKSNKPGSISHNIILSLCVDHHGNLWIGTENGGLNCLSYKSNKFTCFNSEEGNPKSLSSNSIWSIYEDNTGILWIGTYNKGLNIIDEKYEKFELIQRNSHLSNSLVNNSVKGFTEDNLGNLWIATDGGGVCYFNTKTRKFENKIDNSHLSSKAVMAILFDSKQNIWIGTWAGGIERLNRFGKRAKTYKNECGTGPGNNIICIYEDRKGDIWAGTAGRGLLKYDRVTDRFNNVTDKTKKTHLTHTAFINDILEDSNNNIWVGTLFGLVCLKRNNTADYSFSEYLYSSNPSSISSFGITSIFEDSKNNLWVGTEEGLNLFNKKDSTFTVYNKQNGMPNNTVEGILEDYKGNLWISTNQGISKFNPAKGTFKNFTETDGLNTNEFNLQACIRTSSGEFFFGGNNGMNAFYPDSIQLNTYIPPVYVINFKIFNNPVKIGVKDSPLKKIISETHKITLSYKQSSFTLEFVALNYTRPLKNQYAYILEGFDKDWHYAGTRRLATYTNLNPGKYIFKVKGSNNDGLWNNNLTELEITVLPPYWKTFWAYILYFLVLSTVLFGFIRLLIIKSEQAQKLELEKISHEKDIELNKLKIQFFTNVSHELRTPLSLILSPLEQIISLEQVNGELKSRLKLVFRNVEKLFGLVNEIMDFTKSEESRLRMIVQMGDIVKFTHEIYYLFIDEAQRREIDYRFIAETDNISVWFDKNKMEKIILNLISNAFKNTPDKGKITIKLEKSEPENKKEPSNYSKFNAFPNESVKISITDNGPGISPKYLDKVFERFFQSPDDSERSQAGTGIGLALVKNFVELHHGNINVKSEKWKETSFTVVLPIGNSHFKESEIIDEPVGVDSSALETEDLSELNISENMGVFSKRPVILIVEDNKELREYIVSILSKKYKVLEASDGESGFKIALKKLPDLVISDILMPKLTGIEFCKKIKEDFTTSHIPVILLTSKVTIEDQIEGIEKGADRYITKPFNVNYLQVSIAKLIETRRKLLQRFSHDTQIMPKEISNNSLDRKFLEQTVEYINNNVENKVITVENLASYLAMNRSNVYRKIKSLTGQSATEFIRTIRLRMALNYIESGKYNVSEIAYKVGFESPWYFAKCFKKQFGKSPSEFLSGKTKIRTDN